MGFIFFIYSNLFVGVSEMVERERESVRKELKVHCISINERECALKKKNEK